MGQDDGICFHQDGLANNALNTEFYFGGRSSHAQDRKQMALCIEKSREHGFLFAREEKRLKELPARTHANQLNVKTVKLVTKHTRTFAQPTTVGDSA